MGVENPEDQVWEVNGEMTLVYWRSGNATTVVKKHKGRISHMTLLGEDGVTYNNPSKEHRRIVREVLEEFDHQLGRGSVGS